MNYLMFTAVSNSGTAYEIEFPLHPETSSVEAISELSTEILNLISNCVAKYKGLKDGDILQALSMVSAVRCKMIDVEPEVSEKIFKDLFKSNHSAVLNAKQSISSRA